MKLIIFGASGKTGHELVGRALTLGHDVTAYIRPTGHLTVAPNGNLKVHVGTIDDLPGLINAIRGHDVVISALGAAHPMKYDPLIVDGMRNICRAMHQAGVSRLIYLSPLAVKESRKDSGFFLRNIAPTLLRTEIRGHEEREAIIRESGLTYTIIRAPFLTMSTYTGDYRIGSDLTFSGFLPKLSRADTAAAMLDQIGNGLSRKVVRVLPAG